MATRYWVGGAGNWSSTTKWSTTSGGTSGASVPTSADDVIFDANSGGKFTATVDTAQTCASLSITPSSGAGVLQIAITSSLTVTGAFSTSGTAGNNRIWIRGTTYGVRTNLVCNGTVSISDCDFRDIIVNGAAAPISGTRIGNRGACAGITFDAPKTVYMSNPSSSANWHDNVWATSSNGTPSTDNFPLPQDTAIIDNFSVGSGNVIVLLSTIGYVPTVDMSARTLTLSVFFTNNNICYGSWINNSTGSLSLSQSGGLTFSGEGTNTITSAGRTFGTPITIAAYGGTVELADALNIGSQTLTVTNGTFDTKNFAVTTNNLTTSGSNVRFIKLGSSTVTISTASVGFNIGAATNLTFDAGTSTINFTGNISGASFISASNHTFYNVSLTSTNVGNSPFINGNNITFNNLSVAAPASAGFIALGIQGDNTVINGTLTVAGASSTERVFLRSTTVGTPRTLTVNAWSASPADIDFRDITIAGAVGTLSGTRFGDCGGNSGINFPAPKTVYRVGTSTGWGGAGTAWALSSGGTPSADNLPLAQDTVIIDENTTLTGTLSISSTFNIGSIDCSTRTTGITLSFTSNQNIYGSFILGSGLTISGTATVTFSGRGTQTFTSAGKSITFRVNVDTPTGTFQLGDAFTSASAPAVSISLIRGTFDAANYALTLSEFNASGSGVRTLKMGSGLWTITRNGGSTPWSLATTTNLTFLKDTADILLSGNDTTPRTFAGGGLSYNKLTIGGATGTSTTTITGANQFTELASTKTVAHTIAFGTTGQFLGAWTVTGTAGNVVTLTGTATLTLLGSATSGIDYLAMGSIKFADTSTAEFYAGANSTGTATAPVYRTAKPADSVRYWVGGTGNWSDTARWSTSSGGASGASVPRSHDDVVFDSASNATAYTATVNTVTGGVRCKALTIAPPASGNITLAGGTAIVGIHGDVTLPATGLTRTYNGAITLSGSTTGNTFTTNGVTLASNITVNGVGCGWTLGSALNIGGSVTRFTVINGSFNTDSYNLTSGYFESNYSNSRTISLGSSTLDLSASSAANAFDLNTPTNLTFDAGTSQINITHQNSGIRGGGQTFYNISFTNTSAGTRTLTGANTFNNLTLNASATGLTQLSINADQTITGTLTCSGSSAVARGFVSSNTIGTTRTLTVGTLAANDCDFRDITIAGTAAGTAPTRAGNCDGNSGITFPAAKTVYRVGTATDWSSANSWATTSGGTGVTDNFPLAQDTAVIDNNTALTGTLNTTSQTFNVGIVDFSNRTTGITFNHNGNLGIYSGYIMGSGVILSGQSTLNFFGRRTITLTSAGKQLTFAISIQAPNGILQLGDSLTSTSTNGSTLVSGGFDASSYNVTFNQFSSSQTNVRTLNMGSGLWTLTGTSPWNLVATNLTFTKGTANILLSDNSTTTRAFAGGNLSYNKLTIGGNTSTSTTTIQGNNSFTEISSTKTVSHTINLQSSTQRVDAFTATGTVGNVVTILGTSSTLIYTGGSSITDIDYLNVQGRVYGSAGQITDVWYAGANSVNSGSLGWVFAAGVTPPPAANANFFLMFG